jgi:hypothetical protein
MAMAKVGYLPWEWILELLPGLVVLEQLERIG